MITLHCIAEENISISIHKFSSFSFFNLQVVNGGQLDIDVSVLGPSHNIIYSGQRKEYDQLQFNSTVSIPKWLKLIELVINVDHRGG